MKKISKKLIVVIMAGVLTSFFLYILTGHEPRENIKEATFARLAEIRNNKREEVIKYFNNVQSIALAIKNDKVMLNYFDAIRKNNFVADSELEYEIDKHYVSKYSDFYDILFVDSTGFVFHSIRKESDYHKNLFRGSLLGTKLSQRIKDSDKEHFVDYEFYLPSDEPAAFFTVPLREEGRLIGWFVLQTSINSINTILTERNTGDRTLEVYLVNKKKLMLSESRFLEDSTILKLRVDSYAIKEAMAGNTGEKIIKDYRGIRVFSSFERFDVFGTAWIIITEIDEDEVITEHYKKYEEYFQKKIFDYLANATPVKHVLERLVYKKKRVDMNEFARGEPGSLLYTNGVSTCTTIAILLPDKFGYMVHISPVDDIYMPDNEFGELVRIFLKKKGSDFLGGLLARIKYYYVYPHELKKLYFVIIAIHDNSFKNAVDKILDNGIELSNIKFLYNPKASSANVLLDVSKKTVSVEWSFEKSSFLVYASEVEDMGTIVKKIIGYDA